MAQKKKPSNAITSALTGFAQGAFNALSSGLAGQQDAPAPRRRSLREVDAEMRLEQRLPNPTAGQTMAQQMSAARQNPATAPSLSSSIRQAGQNLRSNLPFAPGIGGTVEAVGELGALAGGLFDVGSRAAGPTVGPALAGLEKKASNFVEGLSPKKNRKTNAQISQELQKSRAGYGYPEMPLNAGEGKESPTSYLQGQGGFETGGSALPGQRAIEIAQQRQQQLSRPTQAVRDQRAAEEASMVPTIQEAYNQAGGKGVLGMLGEVLNPLDPFAILATGGYRGARGVIKSVLEGGADAVARSRQMAALKAERAASPTARAARELPSQPIARKAPPEAPVSGEVVENPPASVPLTDRDVPPETLAPSRQPARSRSSAPTRQGGPRQAQRASTLTPYRERSSSSLPNPATELDVKSYPTGQYRSVRKAPIAVDQVVPSVNEAGLTGQAQPLTGRVGPRTSNNFYSKNQVRTQVGTNLVDTGEALEEVPAYIDNLPPTVEAQAALNYGENYRQLPTNRLRQGPSPIEREPLGPLPDIGESPYARPGVDPRVRNAMGEYPGGRGDPDPMTTGLPYWDDPRAARERLARGMLMERQAGEEQVARQLIERQLNEEQVSRQLSERQLREEQAYQQAMQGIDSGVAEQEAAKALGQEDPAFAADPWNAGYAQAAEEDALARQARAEARAEAARARQAIIGESKPTGVETQRGRNAGRVDEAVSSRLSDSAGDDPAWRGDSSYSDMVRDQVLKDLGVTRDEYDAWKASGGSDAGRVTGKAEQVQPVIRSNPNTEQYQRNLTRADEVVEARTDKGFADDPVYVRNIEDDVLMQLGVSREDFERMRSQKEASRKAQEAFQRLQERPRPPAQPRQVPYTREPISDGNATLEGRAYNEDKGYSVRRVQPEEVARRSQIAQLQRQIQQLEQQISDNRQGQLGPDTGNIARTPAQLQEMKNYVESWMRGENPPSRSQRPPAPPQEAPAPPRNASWMSGSQEPRPMEGPNNTNASAKPAQGTPPTPQAAPSTPAARATASQNGSSAAGMQFSSTGGEGRRPFAKAGSARQESDGIPGVFRANRRGADSDGSAPGRAGANDGFQQAGQAQQTPVTPPAQQRATNPDVVPVSEQQVIRDIRDVAGMIQRGETKKRGFVAKVRRALDGPDGGRIVFNDQLPPGVGGAHDGKRRIVMIRRPNAQGAEVVYHELGHVIEANSEIIQKATPGMLSELETLGDPNVIRPTRKGVGPSDSRGDIAYQRGEGLAEFTRLWMEDPAEAAARAPELARAWDKYIDSSGEIGKRLRQVQADVQARQVASDDKLFTAKMMREERSKQLESVSNDDGKIQTTFDRFHPFRRITKAARKLGMKIAASKDPYIKATMLRTRAANQTAKEVKRLETILSDLRNKDDMAAFEEYITALHLKDMDAQGLDTGMETAARIQAKIDQHQARPGFQRMQRELRQFIDDQLEFAVQMRLKGADEAQAMRDKWPNYVPTQRYYELAAQELPVKGSGRAPGGSLQASDPFMDLKGSEREILSPLTTIIENTGNIRLQALKNDVGLDLAELWDKQAPGIGDYMSEVDTPGEGFDFAKNNVLRVKDGRQVRYFQLSPQLFRAITEEAAVSQNLLTRVNQIWGKILRPMATTYNPGFAIANTVRDTMTLPFLARVPGARIPVFPFAEGAALQLGAWANEQRFIPKALKRALGTADARKAVMEFKGTGGFQDFGDSVIERQFAHRTKESMLPKSRARRALGAAGEFLADITSASEMSNRLGHYRAAKRYYKRLHPDWSDADIEMQAAFEARDVLDFSRRGSSENARWVRQNVPFIGAQIEGTRRAAHAVLEQPLQVMMAGLLMGVAPEAAVLAMNRDDPQFWEIPQERRDKYLFFRNPLWDGVNVDNKFIPVPRVPGMFASFSRGLEWADQIGHEEISGRDRAGEMASTLAQDILPANLDPTQWTSLGKAAANLFGLLGPAASTFAELASNTDFYRQRDIVPRGIKKQHASAHNQKNASTSVLAQSIADGFHKGTNGAINVSPMEIDHILYRLLAGTGQAVINNAVDPVISSATGYEPSASRGGTPSERLVDAFRLRYKPTRWRSVDKLDRKVTRLASAVDDGDTDKATELKERQRQQAEVAELIKEFRPSNPDPSVRADLQQRIIDAAKR